MTGLKISPVKICHVYKVLQYSNLLLSTIYLINVWKYIEIFKNVSCNINTPASKSFVKDWDDGCDIIFYPDSKPAFCCLRCHPCLLVRLLWSFCFSSLLLQKKYNRFWCAAKALKFVSTVLKRLLESASSGFSIHFWSTPDCTIQLCIAFEIVQKNQEKMILKKSQTISCPW